MSTESLTDWNRLDAMQDEAIDLSDVPEITPEMVTGYGAERTLANS